jgi:hypothetical protein
MSRIAIRNGFMKMMLPLRSSGLRNGSAALIVRFIVKVHFYLNILLNKHLLDRNIKINT